MLKTKGFLTDLLIALFPIVLLFFIIFFLVSGGHKANATEWYFSEKVRTDTQKETIEKQISEIEKTVFSLPEEDRKNLIKDRISLEQEKNKLAAFSRAYEMALGTEETTILYTAAEEVKGAAAKHMPIYQAAADRYGVDWSILAAIHKIETQYSGIEVMISSVGAIGHMQFMPATWAAYGVDGNGDGKISPWNLEDSIFAAANYLSASGYSKDMRKAIWHYNHAEWYVNDVINTAAELRGIN